VNTIITDADYKAIESLAGVKWREPTVECRVRFGTSQGSLVGIEACGKLWAVHCDDVKAELALVSYLTDHTVFGAECWESVTGTAVPHIAGGVVELQVDGAAAAKVDSKGVVQKMDSASAGLALAATRGTK
jgi:hypothetical protein